MSAVHKNECHRKNTRTSNIGSRHSDICFVSIPRGRDRDASVQYPPTAGLSRRRRLSILVRRISTHGRAGESLDEQPQRSLLAGRAALMADRGDTPEQDSDQTAGDLDQTLADSDQTASDADQTASDADQTASDDDQSLSDRDQHASDRDQATADWEHSHAHGTSSASEAHEASRVERDAVSRERDSTAADRARTTAQRLTTAARRDEAARVRDLTATARDRTAERHDKAADARDRAAGARERRVAEAGVLEDVLAPLRALRVSGTTSRREAALERVAAAADRAAAAADRAAAASDRRDAGLDELTGISRRGTGELALIHEIDRSRRTGGSLILAVIDVDALKAVNDDKGHAAGDALLRDVAASIVSAMRSYDVTVRWGGDEFVCAMSDLNLEVAAERIAEVKRALVGRRPEASISVGLAELNDDDTIEALIARADVALYLAKTNGDT
jgi:diguanylate cyclase (GGDEF)-like protein